MPGESTTEDLRESLSAAYDTSAAATPAEPPQPAPTPAPTPSPAAPPLTEATAPAAPAAAPAPAATTAADLAAAKTAIEEDRPIPERLKAKWGEKWKTIDKELRAEFHQYESNIGSMASKYGKAAKAWEETQRVFAPYSDMVQREGGNFHSALANLFETARILRHGLPEQRVALVQQMCRAYQVPLEALIPGQTSPQSASGEEAPQTAATAPAVGQASPELLNRLAQLERQVLTQSADAEYTSRQKVASEVEAFTADPANVYLQEPGYLDTMVYLIQGGKAPDLKSAYEQAAWLHERTRQLEIAKMNQQRLSPLTEHAARARAAGVSVNGNAPGAVSRDPGKMDLRTALSAAYDGELI